ncbi:uncharacterized protein G2W53_033971 [Senna tora]|uniref:Uncharacterized protein n=1 Tax=Senna tora TaxID=362788 RepID=A0A834SZK1_9FABA|nr:uncharacterized protein G2W53_033971 [Senna tora]
MVELPLEDEMLGDSLALIPIVQKYFEKVKRSRSKVSLVTSPILKFDIGISPVKGKKKCPSPAKRIRKHSKKLYSQLENLLEVPIGEINPRAYGNLFGSMQEDVVAITKDGVVAHLK